MKREERTDEKEKSKKKRERDRDRNREKNCLLSLLDATRKHILARMVGSNVLIKIAALFGSVGAIGAFELRFLATLVPGMPDQGGAMLVPFPACLAPIWKLDSLRHPKGRQVLDQRHHRVVAIPLKVLRHSHTRDRYVCKSQEEQNRGSLVGENKRASLRIGICFFLSDKKSNYDRE